MGRFGLLILFIYLMSIAGKDLGWRNDPGNSHNLQWHQSYSATTKKRSFVLKYHNDKETSLSSEQLHARLLGTAHLSSRDSPSCLTFTYKVTGDKSNKLSIFVNNQSVWSHSSSWGQTQVNISSISLTDSPQATTEIAFDGQFTDNGQIHLENIDITHTPCSSSRVIFYMQPIDADPIQVSQQAISCGFEENICQWQFDPTGNFDWTRHKESTPTYETGPDSGADNSSYYIYIEASVPQKEGDRAGLISPVITKLNRTMCFQFSFHMLGENIGALQISTLQNTPNGQIQNLIWERNETQTGEWRIEQINLRDIPYDFAMKIDGFVGDGVEGDIAVDEIILMDDECPPPLSCDFETSFCGWTNDTTGDFYWTRAQKVTHTSGTGPSTNHTTGTDRGYYLYIETSFPQSVGQKARIVSPIYPPSPSACLRFHYHMFGATIGTLNVLMAGTRQTLWRKTGNLGNRWRYGHVTVRSNNSYQIAFEGIVGSSFLGDIAIDDISITNGPCDIEASCNFDQATICGFYNTKEEDNFDWVLNRGETSTPETGPTVDHTTGTRAGYYVYIEASSPQEHGDKAWLVSEVMESPSGACLEFWYHMKGITTGNLSVYHRILDKQPTSIWFMESDQGDQWINAKVNLPVTLEHYDFIFEGVVGDGFQSDIALDDITVSQGGNCAFFASTTEAPVTPTPLIPFDCGDGTTIPQSVVCNFITDCSNGRDEQVCADCTFEQSTCQWQDMSIGAFAWMREQGMNAGAAQLGPIVDHTTNTGQGYFMYVRTSVGIVWDEAILELQQVLQPSPATCTLEFWHHLDYGQFLRVYLIADNDSIAISEENSVRSDQWERVILPLGRIVRPWRIQFSTVKGFQVGSIAIDDITLTGCRFPPVQGSCTVNQFRCKRGACVSKDRICDFTDDCGDNSDELNCTDNVMCNFEGPTGICDWSQDQDDELDWEMGQGATATMGTGPKRDHTLGLPDGHYIFLESSYPAVKNDRARIASPVMNSTGSSCEFRFYWHMYGENIGSLNVYTRTTYGGHMNKIWSKEYEVGDYWTRTSLQLLIDKPFQVVLEAVVGDGFAGDIAVDDTSFTSGCILANANLVTVTTPALNTTTLNPCEANGQFMCPGINQCIDKICDFTADCSDGSDEYGCGSCSFEKDECGWEDASSTSYSWSRVKASDIVFSSPRAPGYDHTLNTAAGWYMHAAETMDGFTGFAELRSPPIPTSSVQCQVIFYYWLVGNNTGTLELYSSTNNTALWKISSAPANRWNHAIVSVGANPVGWRLFFKLKSNLGILGAWTDDVAIDDISFSKCSVNRTADILDCDFENDFCAWKTADLAGFSWTRASGSTLTSQTGPSGDHTTGAGYYIYIEASAPQKPGDRAWLASPMMPATTSSCLTFYYHMYGQDIGTLNVLIETLNETKNVFTQSGPLGNTWRLGEVNIQSTNSYRIIFESTVGNSFAGDIALDDIVFDTNFCSVLDECDFEQGWCYWQNRSQNDFNWQRGRNGSTSSGTPTIDHTSSTALGHFLFVESYGHEPGDEAHLISPAYTNRQPRCLRLWYHLYGIRPGTLQIRKQSEIGQPEVLWSKSNNQDNVWRRLSITVPAAANAITYKIHIVGVIDVQTTGNVAIDDVFNKEGECSDSNICTFEDDSCGWINAPNSIMDDFDWLIGSGSTPSLLTGPSVDHTIGTSAGHYMYIEASDTLNNSSKAWLVSENYNPGQYCISFWYHLYGEHIGTLNIWTRINLDQPQLQWSLQGNQGDRWSMGMINVNMSEEFHFIIEARHGGGYLGDIAIDDVSVISNFTSQIPTTTTIDPTATPQTDPSTITLYTDLSTPTFSKEPLTTSKSSTHVPITQTTPVTTTTALNCLTFPCYNDGTCNPHPTEAHKFICICTSDFTGEQCENKKPSKNNHLGIILGSIFGGITLIVIIVVGFVFVRPRLCARS